MLLTVTCIPSRWEVFAAAPCFFSEALSPGMCRSL
uniref:Uncharacterized protein n=1 Tax=Anguilla anguilla TaxID=7936 RepID=A0A0E9T9J9_ANGAN